MDDSDNKAIARLLDFFGGAVLIGTIQADIFLYMQNSTLSLRQLIFSGVLCTLGGGVLFCGIFWHKLAPKEESRFTHKLANLASSPMAYVVIIFILWAYLAGMSLISAITNNNQISALRNDELSIANVLHRIVLPRQVTPMQERVIRNMLIQFPSQKFSLRMVSGDNEASEYAGQLGQALVKGGWVRADNPYDYVPSLEEGVRVAMSYPQTTPPANSVSGGDSLKNPNGVKILWMVFGAAAVHVVSSSGEGAATSVPEVVVISVGPPLHDSYQLLRNEDIP